MDTETAQKMEIFNICKKNGHEKNGINVQRFACNIFRNG